MIRIAHAAYFLALAVWVGGLLALTAVVAPTVFRLAPSRSAAGAIFGPTLRTFGYVEMACAGVVAVCSIYLWRAAPREGWVEGVRLGLVALMVLLLFVHVLGIAPAMAQEQGAADRTRFDTLHRWSVRVVGATLLAGLALLVLSAATVKSIR